MIQGFKKWTDEKTVIKERLNKPEHILAIQEMNEHLQDFRCEFIVKQFNSVEESKKVILR